MFEFSPFLKKRVFAMTSDLFIVVVTNYFLMASFTHFLRTIFFHFPLHAQLFLVHKLAMMTSVSLISLTFSYFSIFYYVTNGRTMGKMLFGLKVNSPDGEMTLIQSMQRSFAYFTCAIFGSVLFSLSFLRKDQKSLADIISGTTVIIDNESSEQKKQTEFQLLLFDSINQNNSLDENNEDKAA